MNTPHDTPSPQPGALPSDEALRRALRADASRPAGDSQALQQRVLAQWQLRHPQTQRAAQLALAGAGATAGGWSPLAQPRRWLGLAAVAGTLMVLAWCSRPDPLLDELMQPDVLSQIAIGEL